MIRTHLLVMVQVNGILFKDTIMSYIYNQVIAKQSIIDSRDATILKATNKTAYYTSPTVAWGNVDAIADYTVTTSGGYIAYAIMSANLGGYNAGGNNGYASIGFTVYNGPAGNTATSTSLGTVTVGGSSVGNTGLQGVVTCFNSFSGTLWIRIFKHTQNNTNTTQTVSVY